MDISEIDINLAQQTASISDDAVTYSLPSKPIDLYGVFFDKDINCFQRMPYSVAKEVNRKIEILSSCTSGGRARFCTDSKTLIISVKYRYLAHMNNMPRIGSSGFALIEKEKGKFYYPGCVFPTVKDETGYVGKINLLGGKMRNYTLYFPLYNDYIEEIKLSFDKGAKVTEGEKYRYDLPIMYYGSSITQGASASRPDNCYQAHISRWSNTDYLNLGFSGSAKGEDEMVEYLSTIKSKIFVYDYDHNAPNVEHLERTHYPLYRKYRDKNPDTPIIILTRPDYHREATLERYKVIKNTYDRAIEEGDKNVYFIDGRKFFASKDRAFCTTDKCHPNDLGFYKMAKVLYKAIKPLLK